MVYYSVNELEEAIVVTYKSGRVFDWKIVLF